MIKSVLQLICAGTLIASVLYGAISWLSPVGADAAFAWSVRFGTLIVGGLSLSTLLYFAAKPDPVPDFIWRLRETPFGRGGVVFVFRLVEKEGACWLAIHYQNRFAMRAVAKVVVQPSQNFNMTRNEISAVFADIACGPAAYGIVEVPLGIPRQYQGKKQLFDVGASIDYPDGQGALLRRSVGAPISSVETPGLGNLLSSAVKVALSGSPPSSLGIPTRVKLQLPTGIRDTVEGLPEFEHREEWTLPDVSDAVQPSAAKPTTVD